MPHAAYPGCCESALHSLMAEKNVHKTLSFMEMGAAEQERRKQAQEKYDNDLRVEALQLAQGLLREFLSAKHKSARTSIGKKILGRLIQDLERELSIRKNLPKNHPLQKHVLGDTELAERHWEEHKKAPEKVTTDEGDLFGLKPQGNMWPPLWMRSAKDANVITTVNTSTRDSVQAAFNSCGRCFELNLSHAPCPGHPSTHNTQVSVDLAAPASGWCTETQPHAPHTSKYKPVRCPGVPAYCGSSQPHPLHRWWQKNGNEAFPVEMQCSGIQ